MYTSTDELWDLVQPLLPQAKVRPQGGGTRNTPDRRVFDAVAHVLTTECSWRDLPPQYGISKSTAHRRFLTWSEAGVWSRLRETLQDKAIDDKDFLDSVLALIESACRRTPRSAESDDDPPQPGHTTINVWIH